LITFSGQLGIDFHVKTTNSHWLQEISLNVSCYPYPFGTYNYDTGDVHKMNQYPFTDYCFSNFTWSKTGLGNFLYGWNKVWDKN